MRVPPIVSLLLLPLLGLPATASAKPCAAPAGDSGETLMARAEVARGLAGTEAIALDPTGTCLLISVRTPGTARLVELLLRGVEVPAEAIRFQVDSSALPAGAGRRT